MRTLSKTITPHYFRISLLAPGLLIGLFVTLFLLMHRPLEFSESFCAGILVTFVLLCVSFAYRIVRVHAWLIWSPMPWFLVACAAYFGFGPLIYFFGNDAAREYCHAVYPVSVGDLLHVTMLNGVGVVLVFLVWFWRTNSMPIVRTRRLSDDTMLRAIIFFYVIGVPLRLITLLSNLAIIDFVMPGYLGVFSSFTSAGLVLLTTMSLKRGGAWWILWCAMTILDLIAAMVTYSKLPIIFALMPCIFGYMLFRPGVRSLPWVAVYLASVYLASSSYAIFCYKNGIGSNTLKARASVIDSYFDSERDRFDLSLYESQSWWARLNYANVQVFACREYKDGICGDSFALALIAPIPRILWKDKPIIESGYGFYKRLTGQTTASFGMGFFAESFWNGGWTYVILASVAIGWIFGTVTVFIGEERSIGNVWVLPISLLWIKGGGRVDGWIHTEIVGPGVLTLILIVIFRFFRKDDVFLPVGSRLRLSSSEDRKINKKRRNSSDRSAISITLNTCIQAGDTGPTPVDR